MSPLVFRVRGLLQNRLLRNSGWMVMGQGLRVVVQAVYFMLIARTLGVRQYGSFVGATALIAVLAPFATWGAGNLVVKNVARAPASFAHYWGAAIHATTLSAVLLSLAALGLSRIVLPGSIPVVLVIEVILADLLFTRLVDMGGQAFQAHQRLSKTAAAQFLVSLMRLVGAALLGLMPGKATALTWSGFYLGASVLSAVVVMRWVTVELGTPGWGARLSKSEAIEGFHFSIINSAATIYNDIDKTMLARMATLEATGFYAAAYRILDVAFVPVRSILFAAYSRFFAVGAKGIQGTLRFAARLLPVGLVYSLAAGVALYVLAPVVPALLGSQYAQSATVLRLLSVLPLLRTLHYFAADALSGADRQGIRSAFQAGIAVANVGLNLWLIPLYSWRGAVWSSLICDGSLALCLWAVVLILARRAEGDQAEVGREAGLIGVAAP